MDISGSDLYGVLSVLKDRQLAELLPQKPDHTLVILYKPSGISAVQFWTDSDGLESRLEKTISGMGSDDAVLELLSPEGSTVRMDFAGYKIRCVLEDETEAEAYESVVPVILKGLGLGYEPIRNGIAARPKSYLGTLLSAYELALNKDMYPKITIRDKLGLLKRTLTIESGRKTELTFAITRLDDQPFAREDISHLAYFVQERLGIDPMSQTYSLAGDRQYSIGAKSFLPI